MNKVWKTKWRSGQQEHGSGPEYSGGSGRGSSSRSSATGLPVDSRSAVLPAVGSKRPHTDEPSVDLPVKKPKLSSLHDSTSGIDLATGDSSSPRQIVLLYDKAQETVESPLCARLRSLDASEIILRRYFLEASEVRADVGACAADLVWRRASKDLDLEVPSYSAEEDEYSQASTELAPSRVKARIKDIIKNWTFRLPNLDSNCNVTPKFLRLVQALKSCEPWGEEFRGIIFVKRRAIASAISDLIPMLGEHISFIRAFAFTRQGSLRTNDKQQQDVFRKFKMGIYNLLVATKSAEDLEIPKATIVIRFDLFEGDLSYGFLQSLSTGHLVHMVERGNEKHGHLLSASTTHDSNMVRWLNIVGCRPCGAIPPRPLGPCFSEDSDSEDESLEPPPIIEPIAGGRIYLRDAMSVVYRLASKASMESFPSPLFDFITHASEPPSYICSIRLPGNNIAGEPCSSVVHARRSVCYNVCVKLSEAGLLGPSAFPILKPLMGASVSNRGDRTQDPNNTGVQIHLRKTPHFWSNVMSGTTRIYPTVMIVKHSNQPPHAPLVLLTSKPLDKIPAFKLFFSGTPATIDTYNGAPFTIDGERSIILHMYTLRLCRAVANKPFACPMENMPYFLAPLPAAWSSDRKDRWILPDVASHIPWDLVAHGADSWFAPLKYGKAEDVTKDIEDAVIADRSVELTRRYDILRVRSDLSPLSHPEDSSREREHGSLLDYCKAVRKNFEGLKDETQALIQVSSVMTAVSRLDPTMTPPATPGPTFARYLIPELCVKFTIPASTFRTALLLPSISRRLDSFLLAKELNARFFQHQILDNLLDMAITAPGCRLEYDYERLEMLGDSFLKYLASIYVFINEPTNKEGGLHFARQHIVSNQTLARSFDSMGLPPYIQSKPFGVKSWLPPNFKTSDDVKVESNRLRKECQQSLGDKVVADVAEAILGAAYLSGGNETALMAAKAMNIPFPHVEKWSDFRAKILIPPPKISAKLKPGSLEAVEGMINGKIKHPHLLAQALTHASTSTFERVSYERLELLGDAILDFLVIRHIFERDPKLSPAGLTLLKSAMVSNSTLAALAVSSGLYNHLLLAPSLYSAVESYRKDLQTKQTEEEELARLEKRLPGQYWQEIEPPKMLSDVVESVIGALYISNDMEAVETFFDAFLKPWCDKHITLKTVSHHPTKVLFELIQTQKCQKFQFAKEKSAQGTNCHVLVHGVILASGEGPSPTLAARNASLCALDALAGDAEFLRICDCPKEGKGKKSKNLDEILSGLLEE